MSLPWSVLFGREVFREVWSDFSTRNRTRSIQESAWYRSFIMLDGSTSMDAGDGSSSLSIRATQPIASASRERPSTSVTTLEALHQRFVKRKRQQSAWDAEEARDLRVAEALQLWKHFSCVTIIEYLEAHCGIEPRTALERVRVSLALADLPLLEAELEEGTFQFSHVKELTRVVVAETEEEWVHHTRGMTYREVQRAVAGHVRGDRPTDPTQPDERRNFVGFHLRPSTAARLFAELKALQGDRGDRFVDDDDRINTLCESSAQGRASLARADPEPSAARGDGTKAKPRRCTCRPTQVWITTDGHAFANGVELDDAELATLTCDATIMGHVDDSHGRPQHTLTEKKRTRILARDGFSCRVPGCRSASHLDVHHIIHREHGGDDADANLVSLCSGHHRLHHAGYLDITGRAPHALTIRRVTALEREEPSRPRGRER